MEKKAIEIELTPEQREQIQQAAGKEVRAVKLRLEELEPRLTPDCSRLAAN